MPESGLEVETWMWICDLSHDLSLPQRGGVDGGTVMLTLPRHALIIRSGGSTVEPLSSDRMNLSPSDWRDILKRPQARARD
jgi:hypothetical protein